MHPVTRWQGGVAFSALFLVATCGAQTNNGAIAGSVRDSVTGAPIPGVQLTLAPPAAPEFPPRIGPRQQWKATADDTGNFRFDDLPAAEYELRLTRLGYIGSDYTNRVERVRPGPGSQDMRLTLTPAASIEGRVLDADDGPVGGAYIHAERNGKAFAAVTGPDGGYRINYLAPGDYRLVVRVPYNLRDKTAKKDPETGETLGYPNNFYYPGADQPSGAAPLSLSAGVHRSGLDLRLQKTRLATIAGVIIDGITREPLNGEIELAPESASAADNAFERRVINPGGAFRFELLRAGRYYVLVYRRPNEVPYVNPVEVGTAGAADLRITVPAYGSISGVLKFPEASPEKAKSRGPFQVHLFSRFSPVDSRQVRDDGTFEIPNLPPGTWSVTVFWPTAMFRNDLYVAAIRQNGRSGPIVVSEGANTAVEIELSDKVGQIIGAVVDDMQRPAAGALVVMTGGGSSRLYRFVANREGHFTGQAAPGAYNVTATLEGVSESAACAGQSGELKIEAGASAHIRLELCKH